VLENSPFDETGSHWAAPLYPFVEPIETEAGDLVEMQAQLFRDRLTLSLVRPQG
jgi:hypothetical protein